MVVDALRGRQRRGARLADGGRAHPEVALLAVDGQVQQPAALQDDLAAVADVGVGRRAQRVVLGDVEALALLLGMSRGAR